MSGGPSDAAAADEEIRRILTGTRVWAIVGLGDNPDRPAYGVARFLQSRGKRIVPVHPTAATVHGEPGYRSLSEIPFPVDVVDVFRRSEDAGGVADEALALPGVAAVWFQLGVVDEAAARRVRAAGRAMVMDRCPAIEWPRLLGPL
ncbi:CoA-binding protein [Marinitenerispora sediminis]|uniref:CoA-binding protein n=1 Tax=Marinitenerispora sediminis TaxID=1931232 RepID=A0A368T893_9ACTN|nr:CoA-binding protein [Marinitenerispora sediminis]RCV54307.1 CoA-binding protein [Marinitenerispora sediminis]RCV60520.1 CoA-binding protein [Marinitenerispora sediminis]RCV61072.1 CoA-binding protein [Marinitenerispora sediminis]